MINVRLRNVRLISIVLAKLFNLIPMSKIKYGIFSVCTDFSYSVCTDFWESHLGTLAHLHPALHAQKESVWCEISSRIVYPFFLTPFGRLQITMISSCNSSHFLEKKMRGTYGSNQMGPNLTQQPTLRKFWGYFLTRFKFS